MPKDGLALNTRLTFWALDPRALGMADRVPHSVLCKPLGQVTPSLGLLRCLDLGHDFLVNHQDSSPSKGFLAHEESEGSGNYGVNVEILEFPEYSSSL